MDSSEIATDLKPFFRVFKDGRVERYHNADFLPPSEDPKTGVVSKDVVISSENNVSARLYIPKTATATTTTAINEKLPLLIYIHGGAFCIESAFSSLYHNYLNHLVAEANVIAVSIEYRLAPEHQIPACYEDSWSVLKWVVSNVSSNGSELSEPWLTNHADFGRIYFAGDSAGANIAHNMMTRASDDGEKLGNEVKFVGMALIHPFFGNDKPDKVWMYICPETNGIDDPRLNPAKHPSMLSKLVCDKVLICVAGKDFLKDRGLVYHEALKNSGWLGELKLVETDNEDHVFHLFNPNCENASFLLKEVASFIKCKKIGTEKL